MVKNKSLLGAKRMKLVWVILCGQFNKPELLQKMKMIWAIYGMPKNGLNPSKTELVVKLIAQPQKSGVKRMKQCFRV